MTALAFGDLGRARMAQVGTKKRLLRCGTSSLDDLIPLLYLELRHSWQSQRDLSRTGTAMTQSIRRQCPRGSSLLDFSRAMAASRRSLWCMLRAAPPSSPVGA